VYLFCLQTHGRGSQKDRICSRGPEPLSQSHGPGLFCVPIGLFCVPIGLFCMPVGLLCVPTGLVCVPICLL